MGSKKREVVMLAKLLWVAEPAVAVIGVVENELVGLVVEVAWVLLLEESGKGQVGTLELKANRRA